MFETTPYNINPNDVLPDTKVPPYPAGLYDGEKSHVRYAQPSLKTPTLTLIDALYDYDGDVIVPPGHYELALSSDTRFLLIMQSKNIFVKIPVFKLEKDAEDVQGTYDAKKHATKWWEIRKRRLNAKTEKKRAEAGLKPESDDFVYAEATIEWEKDGGYYLIKYESGSTRAWGAVKQNYFLP